MIRYIITLTNGPTKGLMAERAKATQLAAFKSDLTNR